MAINTIHTISIFSMLVSLILSITGTCGEVTIRTGMARILGSLLLCINMILVQLLVVHIDKTTDAVVSVSSLWGSTGVGIFLVLVIMTCNVIAPLMNKYK